MNTNEADKENLCACFYDSIEGLKGLTVSLDFVPDGPHFEGSEPAWVNITKPGCYVLELGWNTQPATPATAKLIQAWKNLTSEEREGFIAGLEAANAPPAKRFPEEIIF